MLLPLVLSTALAASGDPASEEVRGQIDWQSHPAMHLPWKVYGPGLTERPAPNTHRHAIRQTVSEPALRDSGVRIYLAAAMAAEKAKDPTQARQLILDQFAYVESFIARHPDRYALARTPAEARQILTDTDKMVIVHSIEGGRMVLQDPKDAAFWASQGVALMTLIHLVDDELGGAAINASWLGRQINADAVKKRRKGEPRGLTERGRAAMVELDDAGILVDLTHMSPQSIDESLALMADQGIPPVVTHGKLRAIQDVERAFSAEQVIEIYRLGGSFNLALNGGSLDPDHPSVPTPEAFCPSSMDSFAWHWQVLQDTVDAGLPTIFGVEGRDQLSESQRTVIATGWSSDWNGGISHSRPVYGRKGCHPKRDRPDAALPIDTQGLANPSLLPQHWQRLEQSGANLDPMLRSAEQFLQMWERVRQEEHGPSSLP